MTKKTWSGVGIILGMLVILAVCSYRLLVPVKTNKAPKQISVIVYGNSAERWTAFRQGVDQAAKDFEAIVNFILMENADSSEEQKQLLARETDGEADGIVAAVIDSTEMCEYVTQLSNIIPIVLTESDIEVSGTLPCIQADSYAMGRALAEQILDTSTDVQVTILQTEKRRIAQENRLRGFMDACKDRGKIVNKISTISEETIRQLNEREMQQVLVAMDDMDLERASEAMGEAKKKIKLYGIGSSEKIVHAVDHGIIEGITFQNEFNMGYEAVDILIQKIQKGGSEEAITIDYHQATKETLHQPENERLLYPIIQ